MKVKVAPSLSTSKIDPDQLENKKDAACTGSEEPKAKENVTLAQEVNHFLRTTKLPLKKRSWRS